MLISAYLDSIEGTEKEPLFKSKIIELMKEEGVAKLLALPGVGKIFSALAALGESESIDAFRQTEHYNNIKDFSIRIFDLEKGYFSIHPGPKQLKWIITFAVIFGVVIYLLKRRKKRKL